MIYQKEYILESYRSNYDNYIDNSSIFETMTSISKAHTEYVGINLPKDIVWMVLDWKLRVTRRPRIGEKCSIRTWVPGWNKAYGLRCYDIIDAKGNKCASASSRWALANAKTRRFFRMTPDIMDLYGIDTGISDIEFAPFIKNITKEANPIKSYAINITDDMIDENGHVHNTIYSTLAESVLPDRTDTNSIDISYRKEIECGGKIILDYCTYADKNLVLIRTTTDSSPNAIVLYGNF